MKVLVISNCATKAYIQGMQLLFPDWNVKGVRDVGAAEWVDAGREDFLNFVSHADIYVGTPPRSLERQYPTLAQLPLKKRIIEILIPKFLFRGLHPDIFFLRTKIDPILPPDTIYSRIVVTSYLLNRPPGEAVRAFNESVYRRLGYFDAFDEEITRIRGAFQHYGIDLEQEIRTWLNSGSPFVFTLNHASAAVYYDVLLAAVAGRLIPAHDRDAKREFRNQVDDYMARGPIWPVYPELGAARGIADRLVWRTKQNASYEEFGLEAFVERSYGHLSRTSDLSPAMVPGFEAAIAALGEPIPERRDESAPSFEPAPAM